jgi:predicted transcriptional regulator
MMFKVIATTKPYYVVPEKYNTVLLEEKRNQETEGMKDIITLPEYKIEIPNEKLIECMHMISLHKDNKITKRELKDLALNKNLIEPLMDWKFISVEKIGARHIVSLTDEGINALRFLHESR